MAVIHLIFIHSVKNHFFKTEVKRAWGRKKKNKKEHGFWSQTARIQILAVLFTALSCNPEKVT